MLKPNKKTDSKIHSTEEIKAKTSPYNNDVMAKNLRFLRGLFEYSQQEIADILQISKASYRAMEIGKTNITFETLYSLANFYGIQLGYIISFDISAQLIDLLQIKDNENNLLAFLENFSRLSAGEKEDIKSDIKKLLEYEKKYNNNFRL